MTQTSREKDFLDRIAMLLFGGVSGAVYEFALSLFGVWLFSEWHQKLIPFTSAVFAVLGFFYDNVVYEALLVFVSFLYGLLAGLLSYSGSNWSDLLPPSYSGPPEREPYQPSHLRACVLFGFGTAASLALWQIFR
jgi:hypothetical protein